MVRTQPAAKKFQYENRTGSSVMYHRNIVAGVFETSTNFLDLTNEPFRAEQLFVAMYGTQVVFVDSSADRRAQGRARFLVSSKMYPAFERVWRRIIQLGLF